MTAEAKMSEKEYLKELKERDLKDHVNIKNKMKEHIVTENKEFMKSLVEKDEKNIEEWKNRESLKKSLVKEELSNQIGQKRRASEMQRRAKLEEVT